MLNAITLNKSIVDDGGFSLSLVGESPTGGYMLSIYKHCELVCDTLTSDILADYLSAHADKLTRANHYLGGWAESGKIYLDVSINVIDREGAFTLARASGQGENSGIRWTGINASDFRLPRELV
mgnify:CR=1 FL=1